MAKQRKTPAQRAQEQYDVATRIADRLNSQVGHARSEFDRLKTEADAAVVRRDYLAMHPDLPKQKTPHNQPSITTSTGDTA